VLDHAGRGRHAFRHLREDDPGYFGMAHCTRNVIGSTGACLMTRRTVFAQLHGFDADHAVINNDLDYCLRAASHGLLNVYTPYAKLIHHELASRAGVPESYDAEKFLQRWRGVIAAGDPYFNPNLSRDRDQIVADAEPLETLVAGHPRFARSAVRRILVVKLDHIGDCINALPAIRRLRKYFPTARVAVLAGRATRPVWDAETAVDEVIPFDFFHARSGQGRAPVSPADLSALKEHLHSMAFDLAIDLRKQPDTRGVLQISGADIRVGFDCQGRFPWLDVALEWDEDVPLRAKHGHVADDLIALVEALGAHSEESRATPRNLPTASLSLPQAQQKKLFARPLICIHPASGSVMRQWPLVKFAELIDLLLDLGDYNVALIGGPDEKTVAQEVLDGASAPAPKGPPHRRSQLFDLTGRLPLEQLPTLFARSALFVGNNSGPQHLAAAAGVPTIGIHSGVVDAREWGPLGPRAVAVRKDMACSPCFLEFAEQCQRGLACLLELPVGYVYRACLQFLGRAPRQNIQQPTALGACSA
jgi:ADP-heptose:LPS heptosyltransferase